MCGSVHCCHLGLECTVSACHPLLLQAPEVLRVSQRPYRRSVSLSALDVPTVTLFGDEMHHSAFWPICLYLFL